MKKAVLISCFDWYEKRLEPIYRILSRKYKVTIFLSDFDHIKKETIRKKHDNINYIHVLPYKKNISICRILSHILFAKKIITNIKKDAPDLIYILVPPNIIGYLCAKYKRKHSEVRFIVDIIDLWPESMPVGRIRNSFWGTKWAELRDYSLQFADLIFTECNLYKKELQYCLDNKKVYTNYLYKDLNSKEQERVVEAIRRYNANIAKHNHTIVLGYVGSINNLIDIDQIVTIIEGLSAIRRTVRIKVIGDGNNKDYFLSRLKMAGAIVEYYGIVFDEIKKIEILSECNFGINIMKKTVKVGLTIKSIDYFSYGLPVISNISEDTYDIIQQYGMGINLNENNVDVINQIVTFPLDKKQTIYNYFLCLFSKQRFVSVLEEALSDV